MDCEMECNIKFVLARSRNNSRSLIQIIRHHVKKHSYLPCVPCIVWHKTSAIQSYEQTVYFVNCKHLDSYFEYLYNRFNSQEIN